MTQVSTSGNLEQLNIVKDVRFGRFTWDSPTHDRPVLAARKYEIATGEAMNPIKQDVKNGVLREYKWGDTWLHHVSVSSILMFHVFSCEHEVLVRHMTLVFI